MAELTQRQSVLRGIKTGDIIHASGNHGGPLICLVTSINETKIFARTVTHQLEFAFDRLSGIGAEGEFSIEGTIDSVAPLPVDIYRSLVELDRRFQEKRNGPLSGDEKRALLFTGRFYPRNPIE